MHSNCIQSKKLTLNDLYPTGGFHHNANKWRQRKRTETLQVLGLKAGVKLLTQLQRYNRKKWKVGMSAREFSQYFLAVPCKILPIHCVVFLNYEKEIDSFWGCRDMPLYSINWYTGTPPTTLFFDFNHYKSLFDCVLIVHHRQWITPIFFFTKEEKATELWAPANNCNQDES